MWVDIDQRLFDPAKANAVYNGYMDLLENADTLGFDEMENEHHQNWPASSLPNLIAAGVYQAIQERWPSWCWEIPSLSTTRP